MKRLLPALLRALGLPLCLAVLSACNNAGSGAAGALPQNQLTGFGNPADAGNPTGIAPVGGAVGEGEADKPGATTLRGQVAGSTFAPGSATYDLSGRTLILSLWQSGQACALAQAGSQPTGGILALRLRASSGNPGAGTYTVEASDATAAGSASASYDVLSNRCRSSVSATAGAASRGSVVLLGAPDTSGQGSLVGTFDLVMGEGDRLTGSFVASRCVAPQASRCAGDAPATAAPTPAAPAPSPSTGTVPPPSPGTGTTPGSGTGTTPGTGTTTPPSTGTGTTTPPGTGTTTPPGTGTGTGTTTPGSGTTPGTGTTTPPSTGTGTGTGTGTTPGTGTPPPPSSGTTPDPGTGTGTGTAPSTAPSTGGATASPSLGLLGL